MDSKPTRPMKDPRAGASDGLAWGESGTSEIRKPSQLPSRFDVPVSAIAPLFRARLDRIFICLVDFDLDVNSRATARVLGGYYRSRRLVRLYVHDVEEGRRPMEELFDTFLHEVAHHLEYTEPETFSARACGRVPGRMHSRLFWRILGELKYRWARLQKLAGERE
ncbi:hypothetical protein [Paludisphaera soli]|uniref:hypothetical protein n=1 Tax=Paludisphaera soli TaxID=2712865 RepID=UPI0013EC9FA4|nr:hypothetical protein [Paludisphaera soli]